MALATVRLIWAPSILLEDKPGKIGPGDDEVEAGDTVVDGLLQLMEQARQEVLIVSPYFVPGKPMMDVFRRLRDRGVRIRVLTNSLASNDAPAAHAGYARYRGDLLGMGVELYEMRAAQEAGVTGLGSGGRIGSGSGIGSGAGGGVGSKMNSSRASLHSKAVIVDQRLSVIGSMNLDLRSQRKNSEVALVIRGGALAREATARIDGTLSQGAYRLERDGGGRIVWRAPPDAGFKDATSEPEASTRLKMLVRLIAPFAPDEML
jgi:phosphatidylserine/phosphatidylglycerophosphate/cardiolipin synthase-like enzyme